MSIPYPGCVMPTMRKRQVAPHMRVISYHCVMNAAGLLMLAATEIFKDWHFW
jgi:hypothetical protein